MSWILETGRPVAVVGAGTIGAGWAAFFALSGLKVRVADPSALAAQRVAETVDRARPVMEALGLLSSNPTTPMVVSEVADAMHDVVFGFEPRDAASGGVPLGAAARVRRCLPPV